MYLKSWRPSGEALSQTKRARSGAQSGRASAQLRASAAAGGARGPLRERGAQAKASGSCRFGSRQKPLTAFGSRAKPGVDPGQTNSRSAAAPHALELQPGAGGERRHRTQLPIQPGYCRGRVRSGTAQRSGPSPPRMGSVLLTGKEPSPSAAEPRILLLRQVLALQSDADPCARSQHLAPLTVPRDAQPCQAVCVLTTATPADPPCPQHPAWPQDKRPFLGPLLPTSPGVAEGCPGVPMGSPNPGLCSWSPAALRQQSHKRLNLPH